MFITGALFRYRARTDEVTRPSGVVCAIRELTADTCPTMCTTVGFRTRNRMPKTTYFRTKMFALPDPGDQKATPYVLLALNRERLSNNGGRIRFDFPTLWTSAQQTIFVIAERRRNNISVYFKRVVIAFS